MTFTPSGPIDKLNFVRYMEYEKAFEIASRILEELKPHCIRVEIAGSIRRKKPEVKNIEIVAIPKPYEIGLFSTGIATVVNQWVKVKGELPCKYTQRLLPEGIKLDLFFAEVGNWGLQFAIRTGSARFSKDVLAKGWSNQHYFSKEGYLYQYGSDKRYEIHEEIDLFKRIGIEWVEPELRD